MKSASLLRFLLLCLLCLFGAGTYDVDFTAATFDEAGRKIKNAVTTVRHNGVLIHDQVEINSTTTASGINTVTPIGGPLQLQDHGNPIYYRNIWAVRR